LTTVATTVGKNGGAEMGAPKDCCPHCGKRHCFDDVAYLNAEMYDGKTYRMLCEHCHKPICVHLVRVVRIVEVVKGEHTEEDCDWTPAVVPL
jgi:hypothetical protein